MRLRFLAMAIVRFATLAPAAWADSINTSQVERAFLERSAISAVDEACNLFTDGERYALKSGLYQSQNELLRANFSQYKIDTTAAQVRAHARSLGCDNPTVRDAAATVRDSYRQFAKTNYIEYASAHGVWKASRIEQDQWALAETDAATNVTLGLRRKAAKDEKTGEDKKELRLAIALPANGRPPATVQLYLRDPAKMSEPWLGSLFGSNGQLSPAPRSMTRPEWAAETTEEDDITNKPFYVFYFSKTAAERLDALDPREAIQLELTPNPRETDQTPRRIAFEAGDFKAARNFVLIPQPTYPAPSDAKAKPEAGH